MASMLSATCPGVRSRFTPSASSTSALPLVDETERPPCLATRAPAAAATKAAVVEMLKVCAASPPVPQVSTRCVPFCAGTLAANSRITCAAAAISPTVSFFTRRPVMMPAICTCVSSPRMIWRISDNISSWKISRCSTSRASACCGVIIACLSGNSPAWCGRAR